MTTTEIFEHLVEWSEGSPASWFHVEWDDDESEYALAVVPNVERSVQRFMLVADRSGDAKTAEARLRARGLVTGVKQPMDTEIVVTYEPLLFCGPLSDASRRSLSMLRESVTVGIVDVAGLGSRTTPTLPENPSTIGPFRCVRRAGLLKAAMNGEGFAM
jgi:hypothetical protein